MAISSLPPKPTPLVHFTPYSCLYGIKTTVYSILIGGRSLSIEKVTTMKGLHMSTRTIERINACRAKLQIEGVFGILR